VLHKFTLYLQQPAPPYTVIMSTKLNGADIGSTHCQYCVSITRALHKNSCARSWHLKAVKFKSFTQTVTSTESNQNSNLQITESAPTVHSAKSNDAAATNYHRRLTTLCHYEM